MQIHRSNIMHSWINSLPWFCKILKITQVWSLWKPNHEKYTWSLPSNRFWARAQENKITFSSTIVAPKFACWLLLRPLKLNFFLCIHVLTYNIGLESIFNLYLHILLHIASCLLYTLWCSGRILNPQTKFPWCIWCKPHHHKLSLPSLLYEAPSHWGH